MYYEDIDFSKELNNTALIQLSNFIEYEFGYSGMFDYNNKNGVEEIMYDYRMNYSEIIELLYNNNEIKNTDEFIYYNAHNGTLKSVNKKWLLDYIMNSIPSDLCNGEFKELIESHLGYKIEY